MKLLGYEHFKGISKTNGNAYSGYNLYFGVEVKDEKGKGIKTFEKISVSESKLPEVCPQGLEHCIGKDVTLFLDQYNKVAQLFVSK
jgi:hypothetical protein